MHSKYMCCFCSGSNEDNNFQISSFHSAEFTSHFRPHDTVCNSYFSNVNTKILSPPRAQFDDLWHSECKITSYPQVEGNHCSECMSVNYAFFNCDTVLGLSACNSNFVDCHGPLPCFPCKDIRVLWYHPVVSWSSQISLSSFCWYHHHLHHHH